MQLTTDNNGDKCVTCMALPQVAVGSDCLRKRKMTASAFNKQ